MEYIYYIYINIIPKKLQFAVYGQYVLVYSKPFGVLNVEIGKKLTKLQILSSNMDLDLIVPVFDLRS